MIHFQTAKSRRFLGALGQSDGELVEAVRKLARTHGVETAQVQGAGFIEWVRFATPDRQTGRFVEEALTRQGPFVLASLRGTVSRSSTGYDVSLYAVVAPEGEPGRTLAGLVGRAGILYVEYVVHSLDDVVFLKERDPHTGLPAWVAVAAPGRAPEPARTATGGLHSSGDAPTRARPEAAAAEDLDDDLDDDLLRPGDVLEHPRLGRCVVVHPPDDDERVRVRLANERTVDLHLGMIRLRRSGQVGEFTVYAVEVRRRR